MRLLLSASGLALLAVSLLLAGLGLQVGYSASGWAYVITFGIAAVAALVPKLRKAFYLAMTLFLLTWTFRSCEVQRSTAELQSHTRDVLGGAQGTVLYGTLQLHAGVAESDIAISGAQLIADTHFLKDPDVPLLVSAMQRKYTEVEKHYGTLPTPIAGTFLDLQGKERYDTIRFRGIRTKSAVIFLHGYAGNSVLPCAQFAAAAEAAHFITDCPSYRFNGDWWTRNGQAIVESSIATLRKQGYDRIVLAGLSNGGLGASLLAPKLRTQLSGLILISGASPSAQTSGLPTLVIMGQKDTMMSPKVVADYAHRANAQSVNLPTGHFAMLLNDETTDKAITAYLKKLPRTDAAALTEN